MNKVKFRLITIFSLIAVLFLALGAALCMPVKRAMAATTYTPSSIFWAGTRGEVGASEAEGDKSYVQFTLHHNGSVQYHRDLALKWFEKANETTDEGGAEAQAAPEKKYFSMEFSFREVNFQKFTITFESAEENISKDGKATNALVFTKQDTDLLVQVQAAGDTEPAGDSKIGQDEEIKLTFDETDCSIGEFNVYINGDPVGNFKNIGGYFMEYRSSASSTPNTPITFTADLGEDAQATETQKVLVKSLNGQTFELDSNGKVVDNASPVLVLNEQIYAFTLGQRFNVTYEAIDVCDDSVTVTRRYYMAKKGEDDQYKAPNEDTDDDYKSLSTSTYFLPPDDSNETEEEYVAIRFKLEDDAKVSAYSYLSWYAAKDAAEAVVETLNGYDYIKVNRDKKEPKYLVLKNNGTTEDEAYKTKDGNFKTNDCQDKVDAYQDALNLAAEKANAGSGSYIYLPSLRELIGSDYADYRNLKFSIYYYKQSQTDGSSASSQTSLSYNSLKLEVPEAGRYKFRVTAADAAGNNIMLNYDGELVAVTANNIWDIEGIPEFTFDIVYKGATIEDPKEQDLGYRNDKYTFDKFDIIALSGYTEEYTLYRFDDSKLPEGVSKPTYSSFVENAKDYVTDDKYKDCLVVIDTYQDDVKEDDPKWDRTDNDYEWDPDSSLSFKPKEAGFYVLQLDVTDAQLTGFTATQYQVIEVRNPLDTIPGQSKWLQENVTSVVLFSISGFLAIVIVVLFLMKPSEKKVEEIDLEKLKGKKKHNKK